MKNDFKPFKVGTVWNSIKVKNSTLKFKYIEINYPSRLNAMALDPSKITKNDNLKYSPGEIVFKIKIYKNVKIHVNSESDEFVVSSGSPRASLIHHAACIMKEAIGFKEGLNISVSVEKDLKHIGLGSSSGIISSVACAINELYGNPISKSVLLKYLAQNHGEEIEGESNLLAPVQCIGGSAAAGLYSGGLIMIAGESTVILNDRLSPKLRAVIGVPRGFKEIDAKILLNKEIEAFPKFLDCGIKYGQLITYRLIHEVMPNLKLGKLKALGDLIFDYRFKLGSIENCSYCYPPIVDIAKNISVLRDFVDILSLSSVGPSFFAITSNINECQKKFEEAGLATMVVNLENKPYSIIEKY